MDPKPLPHQDPMQRDPVLDTPVDCMTDAELEMAMLEGDAVDAGLAMDEQRRREQLRELTESEE